MVDVVSDIKDIWFIVLGLVTLVAWSVRLESIVKDNKLKLKELDRMIQEHIKANKTELGSAWHKIDTLRSDVSMSKRTTEVHAGMLKPENMERYHVEAATFKTATNFRLDSIEAMLTELRKGGM